VSLQVKNHYLWSFFIETQAPVDYFERPELLRGLSNDGNLFFCQATTLLILNSPMSWQWQARYFPTVMASEMDREIGDRNETYIPTT
jgi:hypothetical protein